MKACAVGTTVCYNVSTTTHQGIRMQASSIILLSIFLLGGCADSGDATGSPAAEASQEFPDDWFFGDPATRKLHQRMTGRKAPPLRLMDAEGGRARLTDTEGKVVVVDFWGTWCRPCVAALPENVRLMDEYGDQGLLVVGVHDSRRGSDRMGEVARQAGIEYPLFIDHNGQSARSWRVSFWPTIGVIDRKGRLRAMGLNPARLEEVVRTLLAEEVGTDGTKEEPDEQAAATPPPPLPDQLYENPPDRRRLLAETFAARPPVMQAANWMNSKPLDLGSLKGRIVVLDFWGTWCPPCIASIPKNNAIAEKYRDDVVLIGVCHDRGADRMGSVVRSRGINYPVCHDVGNRTGTSFMVNGYPDYYVFDRKGRLRVADCRNDRVEEAIRLLIAEGDD